MNKKYAELDFPAWFDGKDVNEAGISIILASLLGIKIDLIPIADLRKRDEV